MTYRNRNLRALCKAGHGCRVVAYRSQRGSRNRPLGPAHLKARAAAKKRRGTAAG